ncbi:hypothetical protein DBZ36_14850 [Alginatibacterium sediminis]|uniref:ParD-like family protein n=1 Tax=Alginatibacterium sediminis TaxID=2164068 RepID=A0A420E8C6_9ALTE|nr:ParD-like family protein [Alginatibacterium sediminis]RKF15661.1 hypothetical protein DBZ36_14850 [Alginatibacterium sediminis]
MGIVKISDSLHEEIRQASHVMSRSINAQAEFWIKMGRLAELNPQANYHQLMQELLRNAGSELTQSLELTANAS